MLHLFRFCVKILSFGRSERSIGKVGGTVLGPGPPPRPRCQSKSKTTDKKIPSDFVPYAGIPIEHMLGEPVTSVSVLVDSHPIGWMGLFVPVLRSASAARR
jgi:hypothetical protein